MLSISDIVPPGQTYKKYGYKQTINKYIVFWSEARNTFTEIIKAFIKK